MKQPDKLSSAISSKILSIGPEYRNHRGGVGAVINVYSRYFEIFNFVRSYKEGSGLYKSYVFFIGLMKLTIMLLSNPKIKILHIHGASNGSFYRKFIVFIIGKYLFRKKIIYHIHGGGFQVFYEKSNSLSKKMIRAFLNNADTIITLSQWWHDYFKHNFKTKRLLILPNIIDYPEINEKNTKPNGVTFLFFGLISETKGIFDLVNVIANNKHLYLNRIKLLIGGNGRIQDLKDLIKKEQIQDIVEYLGWVNGKEKNTVLNRIDIYILPSYNEGLPISILEAMSYGKAIISTSVGGIPEIVKNKVNGLLIEPGNLEQIEKALNYFLENTELIEEYGALSKNMVQEYLPDSVLKQLTNIYKSVLSNE